MQATHVLKRATSVAICVSAAAPWLAGPAQAALQDRDLDGNGQVDAFYDTDLDITWLRDANVNGAMDWDTAVAWADGYSFAGHSDWRLPTSDTTCFGFGCTASEMGHLWHTELGNVAGAPMTNVGGFLNLSDADYWSGTEFPDSSSAMNFYTGTGYQAYTTKTHMFLAFAVHEGDVAVVPEPHTFALLGLGLAALVLARRSPR